MRTLIAIHRREARQGAGALDTVANSVARSRRWCLGQARTGAGACSDGEALATFGATGIDDRAPAAGAHPFAKTVRALAFYDGGLVGAFGGHLRSLILYAARNWAPNAHASLVSEKPAIRSDNACFRQTQQAKRTPLGIVRRLACIDSIALLVALAQVAGRWKIAVTHYQYSWRG